MLTRQFLTVKDVADLLKVGEVTVRHWIKGAELRAIDVGREWRIAPSDLEHFLQRHATTASSKGKMRQEAGMNLPAEEPEIPSSKVDGTPVGKGPS